MRRGIGHYVGKGLGGASSASKRFGGTSKTAGNLYGALSSTAAGQSAGADNTLNPKLLAGRSATDVMDAVVEAVRPVDGTQDSEASRQAIREGLSDLLEQFPGADLLNLVEDQRLFVIERFISTDIFNRIILDVGKAMQDKAPNVSAALARMKQVKEYVRETIAARFRALRSSASALSSHVIARMASQAMGETFNVFEEYVK